MSFHIRDLVSKMGKRKASEELSQNLNTAKNRKRLLQLKANRPIQFEYEKLKRNELSHVKHVTKEIRDSAQYRNGDPETKRQLDEDLEKRIAIYIAKQ